MRIILVTLFSFLFALSKGQNTDDYVVIRPENGSNTLDTIFGQIDLPNNGVFWNVKINTASGMRKFKTKDVICLQTGDLHFASIPYGKSYAIVPRVMDGAVDLYFYYTGSDRLTFINTMQEDFTGDVKYDDHYLVSEVIWNSTSYFYVYNSDLKTYYKVPRSKNDFIEQIADVFKANEKIYNKIRSGDYKPNQIPLIVKLYNDSMKEH